ncbi:MAG: hypothetical protein A2046_10995 [Bacteroidetes bacterium GWA2_30_7]|nr:MAG: hypothetical protein A2046_10995 [Bacteroidetes bacterium GWA2_30_7]
MKNIFILLLLLSSVYTYSQVVESFDDGDFTNNPVWSGDNSKWEILNGRLHSSDGVTTNYNFYLSTSSDLLLNTQWEFWDSLKFNTSGSNYVDVYLTSDTANLKAVNINGYFVRIGGTPDEISLYKRVGSVLTKIIDGVDGILNTSTNDMKIKVTCDSSSVWTLQRDLTGTGNSYFTEGTVTDITFLTSNYFGIFVQQSTVSFAKMHYFDNFNIGTIVGDTTKPTLDSVIVLSQNTLTLNFSEDLDSVFATDTLNYLVNNLLGNPSTVVLNSTDNKIVTLTFSTNFSDGVINTISVTEIEDLSGNIIDSISKTFTYSLIKANTVFVISSTEIELTFSQIFDSTSAKILTNYSLDNGFGNPTLITVNSDQKSVILKFSQSFVSGTNYTLNIKNITDLNSNLIVETNLSFLYYIPQPYDIVINEIMSDPNPIVLLLPDAEYLELYNTTNYDIELKNWSLTIGTTQKSIPQTTISAKGFLILCSTTMTSIFQNYGNAVGVSSLSLTNEGTTLKIKTNLGQLIDSVQYLKTWAQDVVKYGGWSIEKIDPLNNCSGSGNWIASNDLNGGTPGMDNSVKASNIDTIAPTLISAFILDSNSVSLTFSEVINTNFGNIKSNYFLNNGIGNPDSVEISLNTITLIFTTGFTEGLENTLTISNMSDYCDNITTNISSNFSYFILHPYDVVINEIMADPNPVVALPAWEYIELYNRTNHSIDVTNWSLTVGTTIVKIPNTQIAANGYLIICSNYAYDELSNYGNAVGIYNNPALVDAGRNVTITDNSNTIISSVTYSENWYGDASKNGGGWSLEVIDPNNFCGGIYNWKASVDERGGTPGSVNSILATNIDSVKPDLEYVMVYNETTLLAHFSEVIKPESAQTISNYSVLGYNIDSAKVDGNDGRNIFLYFNQSFVIGVENLLYIQTIYDQCDNLLLSDSAKFTFNKVEPYDVIINELMIDADPYVGLPEYEYLELFNRTNHDIDLIGWTYIGGTTIKEIPFSKIKAGNYLLFCNTNNISAFQQFGSVTGITSFSLPNTEQNITIKDYNGEVIHSVSYSDEWYNNAYKKDGGWSLELIDPNNQCGEISNWTSSTNIKGGTPNAKNSVYNTNVDVTSPSLLRAFVYNLSSNDTLKVWFNEPLKKASLTNKTYYNVDNGVGNPISVIPIENQFNSILLVFSQPFSDNIVYTLTLTDSITDCVGNKIGINNSCRFAIPDTALPKDIIINEVLFDPKGDGVDFVELYNNSEKIVSLRNLKFTNRSDSTLETQVKTISIEDNLFFPNEFKVITISPEIVQGQYNCPDLKAFVKADGMPTYSNTDGTVVLVDTWMNIIDEMAYTDNMHYALLVSVDGVSLERINYNRPSDDVTNWNSAAENVGFATPGYKNSQYSENIENTSELLITPEIFSPDNDGYNDVLNISYKMDNSGYDATISIYDSKGRLVRKLVQNELLAMDGVYSWDGLTDARTKAGIGIYIIYFEAFDLNGNVVKRKEACVLAAKL